MAEVADKPEEPNKDEQELNESKETRKSWSSGSIVELYSDSQKKWIQGKVEKIFDDEEGEWFVVKYDGDTTKQIQRFNESIRPIQNKQEIDDEKKVKDKSENDNQDKVEEPKKESNESKQGDDKPEDNNNDKPETPNEPQQDDEKKVKDKQDDNNKDKVETPKQDEPQQDDEKKVDDKPKDDKKEKGVNFSGIWELKTNTNLDEFMKAQGIGYLKRKLISMANITLYIDHKGDIMKVKAKLPIGSVDEEIPLDGTEKETTNPMGDQIKMKAYFEDDTKTKLIIKSNNLVKKKKVTMERTMPSKNQLVDVMTNEDGITMTRKFERKQ